jgi:hypothetical protein
MKVNYELDGHGEKLGNKHPCLARCIRWANVRITCLRVGVRCLLSIDFRICSFFDPLRRGLTDCR